MSMEFLETVGRVALWLFYIAIAAGLAISIVLTATLAVSLLQNGFRKDDTDMKKAQNSDIMLKSVEKARKRLKQGGSLQMDDYYTICEEALSLVGSLVTKNAVTNMDMPFIAAAFQFWADTERRNLNTLPTATTANEIYHAALDIMQEMAITTTVRGIGSDGK